MFTTLCIYSYIAAPVGDVVHKGKLTEKGRCWKLISVLCVLYQKH
jgi:hypothetical protein